MEDAMGLLKGMNAVTQVLGLKEFEAVDIDEDLEGKVRRIVVVPRTSVGVCPHCQRATTQRHQVRDRVVKDLPMGALNTELVLRVPQYQCQECGTLFTARFSEVAESAHATERFLSRLVDLVRCSDIHNAAAFFGVAEKTLERWYYDYLERLEKPVQYQPIRSLGIDELSRKKNTADIAVC
jgi:transposase